MTSNDFRGATLDEAVRKATAVYRNEHQQKYKRSCGEIEIRIELEKNKLAIIADRSDELERRAKNLEKEAREKVKVAAVEALIAILGPLGVLGRVARLIAGLRTGSVTLNQLRKLVPAIAAVDAGLRLLEAVKDFDEANALASKAERLIENADETRESLFSLIEELDHCEPKPMS